MASWWNDNSEHWGREDWNNQNDDAREAREDSRNNDLSAVAEQRSSAAASSSWWNDNDEHWGRETWRNQNDGASEARGDSHNNDSSAVAGQRSSAAASSSWIGSVETPLVVSQLPTASTWKAMSQRLPPDDWGAKGPGLIIITFGVKYNSPGGKAMEHMYPGLNPESISHRIDDIYGRHHRLHAYGIHCRAQQKFKVGAPRWMELANLGGATIICILRLLLLVMQDTTGAWP